MQLFEAFDLHLHMKFAQAVQLVSSVSDKNLTAASSVFSRERRCTSRRVGCTRRPTSARVSPSECRPHTTSRSEKQLAKMQAG